MDIPVPTDIVHLIETLQPRLTGMPEVRPRGGQPWWLVKCVPGNPAETLIEEVRQNGFAAAEPAGPFIFWARPAQGGELWPLPPFEPSQAPRSQDRARENATQHQAQFPPRIARHQQALHQLPAESEAAEAQRRHIKFLAQCWRDYGRAARGTEPNEPINADTAQAFLGVDRDGLERLIQWNLLTPCYLPVGMQEYALLLSRPEVDALHKDTTWWRGLVTAAP